MSKYHKLVKQYAETIKKIKSLKTEYEALCVEASEAADEQEDPADAFFVAEAIYEKAREVNYEMVCALDMLTQDIEVEYHDVPFAKPRQAGIDGFWREAGLK